MNNSMDISAEKDDFRAGSFSQERRSFIKKSAALAASLTLPLAAMQSCDEPDNGESEEVKAAPINSNEDFKPMSKVNCFSEDGELKEVVFGTIDGFILPDYDPIYDFAGPKITELLKRAGGKPLEEADPEWYKRVKDSMESVVNFLESTDVTVHRPRTNTADELANFALNSKMNNNVYSRDSLVSVGNTMVETSFLTPSRIRNKYAVRYLSMELMKKGNHVISMPQPLDTFNHNMNESPLVEGGDVEIGDGNIYIGNSGQASNSLGVQWFKTAFPDWNVHEIMIDHTRFPHQHLDCVMVAFSNWGCILADDIIGGYKGLPEALQKKKWIELKPEEAHDKLGNFIAINPEEVIMAEEATRLIKEVEALRPRIKVHKFPYYDVGKIGGSLRCNTSPVHRVG